MDTLQIAYKILFSLEHRKKADYMGQIIGPEKLGVEPEKWLEVIETLQGEGYIRGVKIGKDILGDSFADIRNIAITMKGAEYLRENSAMKKFAKAATDVIHIAKP